MVKFKLGWKLRDFGGEQHRLTYHHLIGSNHTQFEQSGTQTNIGEELETMILQKFGGV